MQPHICPRHRYPLPQGGNAPHRSTAGEALEFSRFRVLLRRRQLLADGVPIALGTRGFDLLLLLLEADGSLVTKDEFMTRVWPGIVVSEGNLKHQVSVLRKVLGADRELIRTETGRGYRFIGVVRANNATAASDWRGREGPRSGRISFPYSCLRSFQSVNSPACTERCRFSGLDTTREQPT
jgi:DNA-binding winged helix-turn-helix (wHTH) protein